MLDRLRALEVFVEVVKRDGFARAAEALDTSPANVTRYISDLEAHLGARLLNRTSRKMSLTESGEALFERAKSILDEMADAESIVSSATLQPRGLLRINAPISFGILHLAPLWPQFMLKYPDVELDISLVDRVVDIVEEGYDLAIRISRSGSSSNAARKLATSHNFLCASPEYLQKYGAPTTPADLAQHQCIGYTYAPNGDQWVLTDANKQEHSVKISFVMHANNGDTIRAAALQGVGIARCPTFLSGEDLRTGKLVRVLPDFHLPDIDVLALYPSRRHLSAKVRVMIDFLANAFKGTPPWDRELDKQ